MIQNNTSQLEHSTESLFIYTYLKTLYPLSYTVFLIKLSYYQTKLKKYFFVSFTKKIHSSTHHTHIRLKF